MAFTLRAVLRGTTLQQLRSTARHCAVLRCIADINLFIFTLCKSSDVNTEMADCDRCDDVLVIAYWYLVCNNENESTKKHKCKKKYERRYWIHDVITRPDELGEYHRLVLELRHDPERFRRYFRMSTSQFDVLLDLIGRSRD